jgi:hypothetical protein
MPQLLKPFGAAAGVGGGRTQRGVLDKDGEKPLVSDYRGLAGRFMIRNRARAVKRHPGGDW